MHTLFLALLLLSWLVALIWLLQVLIWLRNLPRVPDLTGDDWARGSTPTLSVIVPARNEEAGITATLRSLLETQDVSLEIIAVDDRSSDRTGVLMDALMAEEPRPPVKLKVLHVTELPPGWLGKTHAMARGVEQAGGEWLLFTDGDILFSPDALGRALRFGVTSRADHLVLLPTVLMQSAGERMMISFLQVLSSLGLRLWRVPDPESPRDCIGVGAFNMIRRDVYDALGGWARLRLDVVEDLALGRLVKREGFRQQAALGPWLVSVRWAEGAWGVVTNLTKNIFALFRFRPELLLAASVAIGLLSLLPLLLCLAGPRAWWPWGLQLAALFLAYRRIGKGQDFSAAQLLTYPVAATLLIVAMLRSMTLALWRGGIDWRGTFYPLSLLRAGAAGEGLPDKPGVQKTSDR